MDEIIDWEDLNKKVEEDIKKDVEETIKKK